MAVQLEDLITPPTADEVKASTYDTMARVGVRTAGWKSGAVVRTVVAVVSAIISAAFTLVSLIARNGFLELTSGDWLTMLARYSYGVERIPASFATGTLTLTNAGGGEYGPFAPGDLIAVAPALSVAKDFENVDTFTLHAHETLVVNVRAKESGAASTVGPGGISELVTTLPGVSCANVDSLVGTEEENDAALKLRCSEKQSSLSPMGPADAYAFRAREATRTDGTNVGVTRVRIIPPPGDGTITIVVANASGAMSAEDVAFVQEEIVANATPIGANPTVVSAYSTAVNVAAELWIYDTSNLSPSGVTALLSTALPVFFGLQPIGGNATTESAPGFLYHEAIRSAIMAANAGIFKAILSTPSSDVSLGTDRIPTLGTLSITTHVVPARGL